MTQAASRPRAAGPAVSSPADKSSGGTRAGATTALGWRSNVTTTETAGLARRGVGEGLADDAAGGPDARRRKRRWPGRRGRGPAFNSAAAWMTFIRRTGCVWASLQKRAGPASATRSDESLSASSKGMASLTSNLPETTRRKVARCAPQPIFCAQFVGQGAHVGALGAGDAEPAERLGVAGKTKAVNVNQPRLCAPLRCPCAPFCKEARP